MHSWPNGARSQIPFSDFWLNVCLHKTYENLDYVDIQKDDRIQKIDRQEINPFYLEYAFFDNIRRNKINNGSELTDTMVNFIVSQRPDIQELSPDQVREWFDNAGKNEFPWRSPFGGKITIDDIEKSQIVLTNIVSKANVLNIEISK